jgi:hypothetical protein
MAKKKPEALKSVQVWIGMTSKKIYWSTSVQEHETFYSRNMNAFIYTKLNLEKNIVKFLWPLTLPIRCSAREP